jgi:hypothetical protein
MIVSSQIFSHIKDSTPQQTSQFSSIVPAGPVQVQSRATASDATSLTPATASETTKSSEPWLFGKNHLAKEYRTLRETFADLFGSNMHEPKLVLAFDEASCLKQRGGRKFSPADVLCRVIGAYSRHHRESVWAVFASTESKIIDFSAPPPVRT